MFETAFRRSHATVSSPAAQFPPRLRHSHSSSSGGTVRYLRECEVMPSNVTAISPAHFADEAISVLEAALAEADERCAAAQRRRATLAEQLRERRSLAMLDTAPEKGTVAENAETVVAKAEAGEAEAEAEAEAGKLFVDGVLFNTIDGVLNYYREQMRDFHNLLFVMNIVKQAKEQQSRELLSHAEFHARRAGREKYYFPRQQTTEELCLTACELGRWQEGALRGDVAQNVDWRQSLASIASEPVIRGSHHSGGGGGGSARGATPTDDDYGGTARTAAVIVKEEEVQPHMDPAAAFSPTLPVACARAAATSADGEPAAKRALTHQASASSVRSRLQLLARPRSVLVRANFSHADTLDTSARSPTVDGAPLQTGYVALCPLHAKKRARVCELLYD